MRAGASGGAPQRARAAHQVARYGIRWRARDMARQREYWLRSTPQTAVFGTFWVGTGLVFLLTDSLVAASGHEWVALFAAGSVMCATGMTARTVARRRARR